MPYGNVIWVEAYTSFGRYWLILRQLVDGTFELYDPQEQAIREKFTTYDEAYDWLSEDEYDRIEGRHYLNPNDEPT